MAQMVDMKRSAADMRSEATAMAAGPDGEQYPYGLCINLDKDELDKLGITTLPPIGSAVHMMAVGTVTRVSQSASQTPQGSDEQTSMAIQITMMSAAVEAPHPDEAKETPADETREMPTILGGYAMQGPTTSVGPG